MRATGGANIHRNERFVSAGPAASLATVACLAGARKPGGTAISGNPDPAEARKTTVRSGLFNSVAERTRDSLLPGIVTTRIEIGYQVYHEMLTIMLRRLSAIVHGRLYTVAGFLVRGVAGLARSRKGPAWRRNSCSIVGLLCTELRLRTLSPPSQRDVISLQTQELGSGIPDLREVSLERLAELGDSVLAHSIALYRQRLRGNGLPLSSFNSSI